MLCVGNRGLLNPLYRALKEHLFDFKILAWLDKLTLVMAFVNDFKDSYLQ